MFLPKDRNVAYGVAVAVVQAAEHERGLWAPLEATQGNQIKAVIRADARGAVTPAEVRDRLRQIARSLA